MSQLLQTQRGRDSEAATLFALFCRTVGWSVRLIVDWADRTWTEVFSESQVCDSFAPLGPGEFLSP